MSGEGARNYRRGATFEYRVMKALTSQGYTVFRCAGSHTPADLIALRSDTPPLLVQCKQRAPLLPKEWNLLLTTARECGALPILANADPKGRHPLRYWLLVGLKDGSGRRQPHVAWKPSAPWTTTQIGWGW